jgi:hypothetical protein
VTPLVEPPIMKARMAPAAPRSAGEGLMLASLGVRHLVFSEARQAIYELNELAAFVLKSLDAGMDVDAIAHELAETQLDPDHAESAVAATLDQLRLLGWGTALPRSRPLPPPIERLARLALLIAGVRVHLFVSKDLVADAEAVFGALIDESHDTDLLLCARVVGSRVSVFSPGKPEWSCERSQFIPLLKAQLIDRVLACARYEVALHAAALVRDDRAVLLVGSPGAGKTTLAIALAKAGFEVLADDVVLLDQAGLVRGLPLPFTAKASSWGLLSHYWPGIAEQPSHRRPDGQTLCYIPHTLADPRPRRIGSVILLDRQDEALAGVEELDPTCALTALVADGATRDERLGPVGFTALVEGLREARCCRLTYSDPLQAVDAVRGFLA